MAGLIAWASKSNMQEKGGAAADFTNAAYVGRGQLSKVGSVRKGLPGLGLGPRVRSPQREEAVCWCRDSCCRCDAVPAGMSEVLAQTQKRRITKGMSEGD